MWAIILGFVTSIKWTFLSKILDVVRGIKWTVSRVSIVLNIALCTVIIFLLIPKNVSDTKIITKDRIISIPAKVGKMDTIYNPIEYRDTIVKQVANPINQKLLIQYNQLLDSISRRAFVEQVISEREYNEVYEDSIVKISIYTNVVGKMLKQAPNYVIKPTKIINKDTITIISEKPATNKLLGGLEVGLPRGGQAIFKGNIYLQNKKSNMFSIGLDNQKTVWLGYYIKF